MTQRITGVDRDDWVQCMSRCLNEDECQRVMEQFFSDAMHGYQLEKVYGESINTNENQKKGE